MNTKQILERFDAVTSARYKPRTREQMHDRFEGLFAYAHLERFTRKQLSGRKGRELLTVYFATTPKKSRKVYASWIKSVWEDGLDLQWPLKRGDLGKTVRTGRRQTPLEKTVAPWAAALEEEHDVYLRVLAHCFLDGGWRPSQVAHFTWANVARGADGVPERIVADGVDQDDKTSARIVFHIPPKFAEAIVALETAAISSLPNAPLLPWRGAKGRVNPRRPSSSRSLGAAWVKYALKHDLPVVRDQMKKHGRVRAGLTPVYLRHHVKTTLRRAGLSMPAMRAWQGHDFDPADMDAVYDNPGDEALIEEQREILPEGALGWFVANHGAPVARILVEGIPAEAIALLRDYLVGAILSRDFGDRMEALRLRSQTPLVAP